MPDLTYAQDRVYYHQPTPILVCNFRLHTDTNTATQHDTRARLCPEPPKTRDDSATGFNLVPAPAPAEPHQPAPLFTSLKSPTQRQNVSRTVATALPHKGDTTLSSTRLSPATLSQLPPFTHPATDKVFPRLATENRASWANRECGIYRLD